MKQQVSELLLKNLARLNENDTTDKEGVFKTLSNFIFLILGVFENLVAISTDYAEEIGRSTNLLHWLLNRMSEKESDSVRNYAGELLAVFVQYSSGTNDI